MSLSKKYPRGAKSIMAFFMFAIMILAGCAAEPVPVEFPTSHPANPQAHETEFTPPQNPFQTDVAFMGEEPESDSMMMPKPHEKHGKQNMDHKMGIDKKSPSGSKSTKKSGHGEVDNQHKGHSQ